MSGAHVLVVDDNRDLARGVALVLAPEASRISVANSAEKALEILEDNPADLVLSDVKMPGKDGLSLLDTLRERWPETRVILFTAYGTIESAVAAMKRGACDYLTKPFDNDQLVLIVRRALKEIDAQQEIARLRAEAAARDGLHGLYARDRHMLPVVEAIQRVGPTLATVLVVGESGTGKELVARAIHAASDRKSGPFVAFNAAAVPESLAEAELFGAKKGAYTGADRDRRGLFAQADGGTLFIDEVASMPMSLQGKLLRALQEREILPVGASTPVPVDVRIVAATNVDPRKLVRDGTMRKDLYYRLSVMRIAIPPLRERVEDIPLLVDVFLARRAKNAPPKRMSPGALRVLIGHDWPGNVRELENVIERACLLARGEEIEARDIALEDDEPGIEWRADAEPESGEAYEDAKRKAVERFQRRYVEQLMRECDGNVTAAARKAGLTRAALHRILKRMDGATGDEPDEPEE